jgi:hypothetical protein
MDEETKEREGGERGVTMMNFQQKKPEEAF